MGCLARIRLAAASPFLRMNSVFQATRPLASSSARRNLPLLAVPPLRSGKGGELMAMAASIRLQRSASRSRAPPPRLQVQVPRHFVDSHTDRDRIIVVLTIWLDLLGFNQITPASSRLAGAFLCAAGPSSVFIQSRTS